MNKILYWNYERCYQLALTCRNITELREKSYTAYSKATKNGWRKDYTWMTRKPIDIESEVYCIYAYEDAENKHVYVGLTNNLKRRITEHKKKNYKISCEGKFDTVKQYFIEQNKEIPEPIVILENLKGYEAQEKEKQVLDDYINKGWIPINIAKTGEKSSSIGSVGYGKWTREECIKAVAQCQTRSEFARRFPGADDSVRRHGWVDILPEKQKRRESKYYYADECIELSKHYKDIEEVKEKDPKLYESLRQRNLVLKCFPKKELTLTFEECSEIANRFNSWDDFRKNEHELANYSIKMGWKWGDLHKKEITNFSYEECLNVCGKYDTRTQLLKNNSSMYRFCKNKGWLDDLLPLKTTIKDETTIEEMIKLAKKYDCRTHFRKDYGTYYEKLLENNLLDEIYGKDKKYIIDENYAISESKKYTSSVFMKKRWYLYKKCRENGWVDKLQFKEELETAKKNEEEIKNEKIKTATSTALTCSTKKEFRENYPKEYQIASQYKLLKTFTWLKGCKKEYSFEECEEHARTCHSIHEFAEKYPSSYDYARVNKWVRNFTWLYKKNQKKF